MLDCSPLSWEPLDQFQPSSTYEGGPMPVWLALDEVIDPVSGFSPCISGVACAGQDSSYAVSRCSPTPSRQPTPVLHDISTPLDAMIFSTVPLEPCLTGHHGVECFRVLDPHQGYFRTLSPFVDVAELPACRAQRCTVRWPTVWGNVMGDLQGVSRSVNPRGSQCYEPPCSISRACPCNTVGRWVLVVL